MQARSALSSVYEQILNIKMVLNWGSHPKLVSSYSEVFFSGKVVSCLSRKKPTQKCQEPEYLLCCGWYPYHPQFLSVIVKMELSFARSQRTTLTTGWERCVQLCWVGGGGHGKNDQEVSCFKPKKPPWNLNCFTWCASIFSVPFLLAIPYLHSYCL